MSTDLKKLSRAELIDIIYELEKQAKENDKLLSEANERLKDRNIKINEAGSIAQAALAVNGIFETAQKAADDYLNSVKSNFKAGDITPDTAKAQSEEIIARAQKEADDIIASAQEKSKALLDKTDKDIRFKWLTLQKNVNELISSHEELKALVNNK